MKKIIFLFGCMLFITNAFAIETEPFPLSGKIVFACTDKICILNLAKRMLIRIPYKPSPNDIFQTTKVNAGKQMLLSVCWKNQGCAIAKLNPDKKEHISTIIDNAICPTYIPTAQKLLYYGYKIIPNKRLQWQLYAAKYVDGTTIIEGQTPINGDNTALLIPINKNMVAFNGGKLFYGINAADMVWLYNADTNKFSKTNIEYSVPLIWRNATNQLLCAANNHNEIFYYLTSIDGKNRQQVKFFADQDMQNLIVIPVLYIPIYDVVILSVHDRESATPFLWAYDFKTKKKQRLMPGFAFNLGDGVYFEQ